MTSMAKGRGLVCEFFDERDAENDAEDAVEGAGVGDGVEVRADEEARRVWREAAGRGRADCRRRRRGRSCLRLRIQPPSSVWTSMHGGREEGARGFAGDFGDRRESRGSGR